MSEMPSTMTYSIGPSTFLIAPEAGCRLMKWDVKAATGKRDVLHWPQVSEDQDFAKIRGGNPILFPFCGKVFQNGIEGCWKPDPKRALPMPQHGFARQGNFKVVDKGATYVEAQLVPNAEAEEAYPFAYEFSVRYTFEELALDVSLFLKNKDSIAIPWSAGHHFYFNLPWHPNASRSDYELHMEARKSAYMGPDGKLVPSRERHKQHVLGDPVLIDRIHWELRHNQISFGPKSGDEDVFITIGEKTPPSPVMTIVTWAESPDAPYFCIEPWMGPANAAEHGKGLHWVNPGEQSEFKIRVSLY